MQLDAVKQMVPLLTRNSAVADKPRNALVQKYNGVADNAEFGRSALKGACINTEPQKLGSSETSLSLGMGGVADPKINAPLPRYHVKFGSSVTNGGCINRRNPQNWGMLAPLRTGCG